MSPTPTLLPVHRRQVMRWAVIGTAVIIGLHVLGWYLFQQGIVRTKGMRLLFDLRTEGNVASAFSALLWLVGSLLMVIIHVQERQAGQGRREWAWLAVLFLFLACDEVAQVHEKLNRSMRAVLGGGDQGMLNYGWVIPYAVLAIIVLVTCVGFLRSMDRRTARGLFMAGAVFVAGALGMELVEASHMRLSMDSPFIFLSTTVEETLEMTGLLLLINTLLVHWQRHDRGMQVRCVP